MKLFKILFISTIAVLFLTDCQNSKNPDDIPADLYDDAYYASLASITSDSPFFTMTNDGGAIEFSADGGNVVISVSCGTAWVMEKTEEDLFDVDVDDVEGTLTVSASQNSSEEVLSSRISLMTAIDRIPFASIEISQIAYVFPEINIGATSWHAPAKGNLATEISISTDCEWAIEYVSEDWVAVEKSDSGISISLIENDGTEEKYAEIVLSFTDNIKTIYKTVTVIQDGSAYISLSQSILELSADDQSASVTVESNFDWDFKYSSTGGWLWAIREGNDLVITAEANKYAFERAGTVTFSVGDGYENTAQATLIVNQTIAEKNALIFVLSITNTKAITTLPLCGTIDCDIDWGDGGAIESFDRYIHKDYFSNPVTHTYSNTGQFEVKIYGTVTELNNTYIGTQTNISEVRQWGKTGLTSMYGAFYSNRLITFLPEDTYGAFESVSDFTEAFCFCTSLRTVSQNLFNYCSDVTSFNGTFMDCSSLESVPSDLFLKCTNVMSFTNTFSRCTSIDSVPSDLFSNCSEVLYFQYTFSGCTSMTSVPAGLFKHCSKVTSFYCCFQECTSLAAVASGLFDGCPNVTSFYATFWKCSSLASVPENMFDNCRNVTDFYYTFCLCSSLTGESPYTVVNGTKVHLYERSAATGFTTPTSYTACFKNCSGLSDYSDIPDSWK